MDFLCVQFHHTINLLKNLVKKYSDKFRVDEYIEYKGGDPDGRIINCGCQLWLSHGRCGLSAYTVRQAPGHAHPIGNGATIRNPFNLWAIGRHQSRHH